MAIGKKLRFEVFKRDGFTCQYCGKNPPSVTLEVDHIIPVSKDGSDCLDNLITSCFDCNRGKAANELSVLPESTISKTKKLREKQKQYRQFQKALAEDEAMMQADISAVASIYELYNPSRQLIESFRNGSVRQFIKKLGIAEVTDAMHIACSKGNYDPTKYFCGICWNKIKGNG